jgi:putative transposase
MTILFVRHQFPLIRHAVWLYGEFTLSYPDVEDLPAERGLDVSYQTARRWVSKFGPLLARQLRRRRPRPTARRHLDEMAMTIASWKFWLWRTVDDKREVLDLHAQRRRDKAAPRDVTHTAKVPEEKRALSPNTCRANCGLRRTTPLPRMTKIG